LLAVVQDLEAGGGDTGGWSVGLVDAGEQPLDSLGAHVGEPDDTYIHGSDLRDLDYRDRTGPLAGAHD
jgi:hypothetical protein